MTFVILAPALTCPSLAKAGSPVEILLVSQTKGIEDDMYDITYSSWRSNKEKSVDKKDIRILSSESEHNISAQVMSAYRKRGYKNVVRAEMAISEAKGLCKLNNPFPEDVHDLVHQLKPPPFHSDESVHLHHPFYIGEKDCLNIAHISDSHIAARMEVLEKRWNTNFGEAWTKSSLSGKKPGRFSNYNSQVEHILKDINEDDTIDIIIHTGDIIDYNKGYYTEGEDDLSQNYCYDRNWLLFYEILLSNYEKPFFSVLGNHDYRVNPYPPNPIVISRRIREFFNMAPTVNLTRPEMNILHEDPYALNITRAHILTSRRAVAWYSLVINPFYDYSVFYGNMAFLMLDWNRWEDHEGGNPWARAVLSQHQWKLLTKWHARVRDLRKKRRIISVVAMHPSVFNPFPEIGDRKLRTNPDTDIFYRSILMDTYAAENDLVDGTFRQKRNEFIKLCLGNENYGESYTLFPEEGVDVILTGHAHRSGFFQIEGPDVYLKTSDTLKKGPIFCNAMSCGPIGIKNEEGGLERIQLDPPGYTFIAIDDAISVTVRSSNLVPIREEARRSFGEIARGGAFEVSEEVTDLPGLNPVYYFTVTNLREESTITQIRIATGLKHPVEVTKTPLGWRHFVAKAEGFTHIVCEAHDRAQGIFYEDEGEIHIKAADKSIEKMGTLSVCWDMKDEPSLPVCVKVPAEALRH